jgi:uncharacterized protein (DUF1501 family)
MCNHNEHQRPGTDLSDQDAHRADHKTWSRRNFLQTIGLAGATGFTMSGLPITSLFAAPLTDALGGDSERKLVLIRLKGGNDGLNTFVPLYAYDTYREARPRLAHAEPDLTTLTERFAMPTAMNPLTSLWDSGQMRVVNSVGYPNHSLSHFTGADIMGSGDSNPAENVSGWLARYYVDQNPDYIENPGSFPPAVKIGGPTSLIFNDEDGIDLSANFASAGQLNDLAQTGRAFNNQEAPDTCYYGEQVIFLRTIANAAATYSTAIFEAYQNSQTEADYGSTLGEQLKLVARLIKGGLPTQFYLVTLDGFDTHVSQNTTADHLGLLNDLSTAVRAFYEDLAAGGRDGEVLSMTYSEFGRRVEQNGFNGTDHGTALPVMFFGPALEGSGFHGLEPDLTDLDEFGNLRFGTDFRAIYATVLQEWLCLAPETVDAVLGDSYQRLTDIGISCSISSTFVPAQRQQPLHRLATLGGGQYQLILDVPRSGKLTVEILTIGGQRVQRIASQYYHAGTHQIPFSLSHLSIELMPMVYVIHGMGTQQVGKFIGSSR